MKLSRGVGCATLTWIISAASLSSLSVCRSHRAEPQNIIVIGLTPLSCRFDEHYHCRSALAILPRRRSIFVSGLPLLMSRATEYYLHRSAAVVVPRRLAFLLFSVCRPRRAVPPKIISNESPPRRRCCFGVPPRRAHCL